MPVVTPLSECVARPDSDGQRYLLVDHLIRVAHAAGDPGGSVPDRLAFLAGLIHDAAKCHEDWQDYVDSGTSRKKGPPHAPMGAALFCFVANRLIIGWCDKRTDRRAARDQILNWTMAIQGHHGKLGDFSATTLPWLAIGSKYAVPGLVSGCDLQGVFNLVRQYYPSFTATAADFSQWLENFDRDWLELADIERKRVVEKGVHHEIAMRFPHVFSRLIIADRIDAGNLTDEDLCTSDAREALSTLAAFCAHEATNALEEGADEALVRLRGLIQDEAAATYSANAGKAFYTLLLPTGYGKTLSSLRVALEACAAGKCRRIIYVAPYISILSQAAKEIADASGLRVFEHHHLSLIKIASEQEKGVDGNDDSSEVLADSDDDFDVLDTWKAPVIATTFNQFFRTLFPARAQQTLRIDAVENAFVIIDEPQIIDVGVWNLFLRALDVFAAQNKCQVIFSTATLPPLDIGIQSNVVPLAPRVPSLHRYDIEYRAASHSLSELRDLVETNVARCRSLAVVLNTVRDAYLVYNALEGGSLARSTTYCLTAMMLPGHKHRTIRQIRKHLKHQREETTDQKITVVCTQILEAGVNLSFRSVLRARSIFPSVTQVAGRANRHNEGVPATVIVFPFIAGAGRELRQYVYRDATAIEMTDRVFDHYPLIPETSIVERLREYFDDCWQRNSQSAVLKRFEQAALGKWSCLANIEPFGFSPPREEVFVPVPMSALDDDSRALICRFAPQGAEQLLDRYLDKDFQRTLDFRAKKLLSIALRQFVVPTRIDVAEQIATRVSDWLWLIKDIDYYSNETGLAHWLAHEPFDDNTNPII